MLNFFKSEKNNAVFLQVSKGDTPQNGELELLTANTVDASAEKHVPIVTVENDMVVVRIGTQAHPMLPEHYIEWVFVQTSAGGVFCNLTPGDPPEVSFPIEPGEVVSVYIYCNLHGLWKAKEPVLPNYFETNDVACSAEFTQGCIDPLKTEGVL